MDDMRTLGKAAKRFKNNKGWKRLGFGCDLDPIDKNVLQKRKELKARKAQVLKSIINRRAMQRHGKKIATAVREREKVYTKFFYGTPRNIRVAI